MGKIYEQLSIEERTMIQAQLEMGTKPASIAAGLGHSASTLSCELRRNGWTRPEPCRGPGRLPVAGGYHAPAAQKRARPARSNRVSSTACGLRGINKALRELLEP